MGLIALAIKLDSKGSVFFKQKRVGINKEHFEILKFRTMIKESEIDGAQWSTGDDDPRITPVGRILRKFRLDELPQFWNILNGSMSFVGPRPERECFYEEFEKWLNSEEKEQLRCVVEYKSSIKNRMNLIKSREFRSDSTKRNIRLRR